MKTRYGMYGLSGISGLGFAPEEHERRLQEALRDQRSYTKGLNQALREAFDPENGTTCSDAYAQAKTVIGAQRSIYEHFFAANPNAEEMPKFPESVAARTALKEFRAKCILPKADENAKPWYKRMLKRSGVSGFGSERTPGQEKYNEPNMEYRRTREEHDSVEELEAEADKLLFHADSILDEHRGASSLCDNILLSIREAARILGSAEVEAGYASRGALDEHLNSTTEKFIKKCVRKPRG